MKMAHLLILTSEIKSPVNGLVNNVSSAGIILHSAG